jgi:hypothetical protein
VDTDGPKFALRITSARLEHKHRLSKRTFDQYPENRLSLESEVVQTVDQLRKAGAKKKNIMKYIHENSTCNPTNRDVHNLVRNLTKQSDTAQTSSKRLNQWMMEFASEPGNIGRIFVDTFGKRYDFIATTLHFAVILTFRFFVVDYRHVHYAAD